MAKPTRVISEDLAWSDSLSRCSLETELSWPRFLLAVDSFGRCFADPSWLARTMFPRRPGMKRKVKRWLDELSCHEKHDSRPPVIVYEAEGMLLMQVDAWEKRNNLRRRGDCKLPGPNGKREPHSGSSSRTESGTDSGSLVPGVGVGVGVGGGVGEGERGGSSSASIPSRPPPTDPPDFAAALALADAAAEAARVAFPGSAWCDPRSWPLNRSSEARHLIRLAGLGVKPSTVRDRVVFVGEHGHEPGCGFTVAGCSDVASKWDRIGMAMERQKRAATRPPETDDPAALARAEVERLRANPGAV